MDKIKQYGKDLSIRKSFILYVLVFTILTLILSAVTTFLCHNAINTIQEESYSESGEKYYLTTKEGKQLGEGVYISSSPTLLNPKDEHLITLLEVIPMVTTPLYAALCIVAAAYLFYRHKLRRPLTELKKAAERIAMNDLDFIVDYQSKDELGQLCASFELMHQMLKKNFADIWRQVEERKQLNAAFAHDLRTPLTVLKGYNELLQESENLQTQDIAITMKKHIGRMESYIDSMSQLRRLEDSKPEYQQVNLQSFLKPLCESLEMVCKQKEKQLEVNNKVPNLSVILDTAFVTQVCDNLISNALRYAKAIVTLTFEVDDSGLKLIVSDDGQGFNKENLEQVTQPYFTEEINHSTHFGLGLYICKLLCEYHNGYLKIENNNKGAKVTAFFKFNAE